MTVAVVAPSSPVALSPERERAFRDGLEAMIAHGYQPVPMSNVFAADGWRAGSIESRLADLYQAFTTPGAGLVQAARGGHSAATLLPHIDFARLDGAVPYLGYSDSTALLLALAKKTRTPVFHGPMVSDMSALGTKSLASLRAAIDGEPTSLGAPKWLRGEAVSGPLVAGNLVTLCAMIGTPYEPEWDGAVLFTEEVGEPGSRIERALAQLRNAGILEKLSGLVFGRATRCDFSANGWTGSLESLLLEATIGLPLSLALSDAFGHRPGEHLTLPLGRGVQMMPEAIDVGLL